MDIYPVEVGCHLSESHTSYVIAVSQNRKGRESKGGLDTKSVAISLVFRFFGLHGILIVP